MSFATLANLVTMMLCFAVVVQSMRMMRSLRAVKDGALAKTVDALDRATSEARAVLFEMKGALADCARNQRVVEDAGEMRDELSTILAMADSAAERLADRISDANALSRTGAAEAPLDLETEAEAA